jgi:hypothetical protein
VASMHTSLIAEIERYLAAVEVFRAEGCRLVWREEEAAPSRPAQEPRCRELTWLERG